MRNFSKILFFYTSLSILLSVSVLLFFIFSNRDKIVYVDSTKLLSGYMGMIEARKEFEKKQTAWQMNIDTLTKEVQTAIQDYEKTNSVGTAKEKSLSQQLIQTKQKQLIDYQNAIKQNEEEEQNRLNEKVYSTINNYLLQYGKKNGYKIILIAVNGNIAYADSSLDITDKVVKELNQQYKAP